MNSYEIMREQIINKIVNNYKSGDIVHINCNWLQRYDKDLVDIVFKDLVKIKILKFVYGYKCPKCNEYKVEYFDSKYSLAWCGGICDKCERVMDEVQTYKKV